MVVEMIDSDSKNKLISLNKKCIRWKHLRKTNPTSSEIESLLIFINEDVESLLPIYKTKDAIKSALKELANEPKPKNQLYKTCKRCGGTGSYMGRGECFACNGRGSVLTAYGLRVCDWKESIKYYTSNEHEKNIKSLNDSIANLQKLIDETTHNGMREKYKNDLEHAKSALEKSIVEKSEFAKLYEQYGNELPKGYKIKSSIL